jgi:Na+-driven multidrug efflux pump
MNVLFVAALLPRWGLIGAAYGVLFAEIIGAIVRWLVFRAGVRPSREKRGPEMDGAAPDQM